MSKMTRAQWLFEYLALQQKEREEREFWLKNAQRMAIRVLGLDAIQHLQLGPDAPPDDGKPKDPLDAWVPFAYIGANHHLLAGFLKQMKKATGMDEEGDGHTDGTIGMNDDEFEKLSKKMAESSDMEPIIDDPFSGADLKQLLASREAKLLGVQQVEDIVSPSVSVTSIEDE